ncbi:hypothetical protein ACFWBF_11670 [Streptomyces sp. NPDC060028]|uniref:hypothetical protein n=1 Tax=Streptomyces sp. NPDC060028 TaxID=3347041 RepID=UPI0036A5B0AF
MCTGLPCPGLLARARWVGQAPRLAVAAWGVLAATFTAAVSLLILATTDDGDGYGRALAAMLFLGFGAGFIIGPTSDAIVGSLPEDDLGVGSATNSAAVQLGSALGVAVLGSQHLPGRATVRAAACAVSGEARRISPPGPVGAVGQRH